MAGRDWFPMPPGETVYILECSDGSFYVGRTSDVTRRLAEHAAGLGSPYTATRRPVRLVYCESCLSAADACTRERQLKGWTRSKKQALVDGQLERVHHLARRRQR